MEITIGVQNLARELVVETDDTAEAVTTAVREAIAGDSGLLEITDSRGRTILVPTATIGYVEVGAEEQRKVGFGAL